MFELSHSTTLPTAPVEAWFISSSAVNVPDGEVTNIAFVPLNVVALAAEPPDSISLIKTTFLKSLAVVKSPVLPDSEASKFVFNITKKPPNSSIAFLPWPPFGSIITSNSAPDKEPPPAVLISATLI